MRYFAVILCAFLGLVVQANASCVLSAALQDTVNAAPAGYKITVCPGPIAGLTINKSLSLEFLCGTYQVSAPITLQNLNGMAVRGCMRSDNGGMSTQFSWSGNATDCMFSLQNVSFGTFEDFLVNSNPGAPLNNAFCSPNIPAVGPYLSTHNTFSRITINGTSPGGLGYGFRIAYGGGGSQNNNDVFSWDNVTIENYSIGWSFENTQSKQHVLRNVTFLTGQYGITTALGIGTTGGSFQAFGINGGYNSGSDIYLGGPDDAIYVAGGNLEGSSRLLFTAGASSSAWPVTIQGVRWGAGGLSADGRAVVYTQRGPLTLIGNTFDSPSIPLTINVAPSGPSAAVMIGNQIWSSVANPFQDSSGFTHWTLLGNVLSDPSTGSGAPLPNGL